MNTTTTKSITDAALIASRETELALGIIAMSGHNPLELTLAMDQAKKTTAAIEKIPTVKNAQFYGAVGDGITDDTDAIQRMADTGEMIFDKPAVYLIDPVKRITISKNGTRMRTLDGDGEVVFKAKTNSAAKYRIFNVNASDCDLNMGGAYVVGDRETHRWSSQTDPAQNTHEWGYCFFLGGERNKLYGTGRGLFTGATGDGLGITGPDHEVFGLVLDGNRRQGCSAFNAPRLNFHDNICRNTGNNGLQDPAPKKLIGPFCGLDIEPDGGDCLDVNIHRNTFGPNNRSGAIAWVNSRAGVVKLSGRLHGNHFIGNSNGSWLNDEVAGRYNINFIFTRNQFTNNKNHDIRCDQGTIVKVGDGTEFNANVFDDFNERTDRLRAGVVSPEIGVYRGAKVSAPLNAYV